MKRSTKILLIILTLIIIIIFFCLPNKEKTVVNGFTVFGTYFSLLGLLIAYIQIRSIKKTSEATKTAVNESLLEMSRVLSVSDITKSVRTIREIQSFFPQHKYEIALMRMKDLKSLVIQFKYNEELTENTQKNNYKQRIRNLGLDINNLHELICKNIEPESVNIPKINQNLENFATTLTEFENILKTQKP